MNLRIEPLHPLIGARITGVDLREPLSPATYEQIEDALAVHSVLGFTHQPLDDDQQVRFSSGFGQLHQASRDPSQRRIKDPNFQDVSNLNLEGAIARNGERGYSDANLLWHTDLSFVPNRARITVLSARELPPEPPPTEFADMRAAWDALAPERQHALEGLQVEHSIFWSREQMGMKASDFSEETLRERKPVVHPLVRINARTGRKSLYLASHASHVLGRPQEEGRAMIRELMAHATRPEFVYSHHWKPSELVMWDDSWTMHRATPYKDKHPRQMRWCGVRELEAV
ncbi:MAG: TauD/TfdA family dioxygenase [Oxalobacteraceae bacterium]|nr:MAG: TauD/TfdA family dioxygenase [Oxalobacteraceae bacterium]